jgi:hypothetical protein
MYLEFSELSRLNQLAEDYRKEFNVNPLEMGPEVRPDLNTDRMRRSFLAHRQLFFYNQSRQMTNFPHHYFRALTEMDPQTVNGRKLLFQAERFRKAAIPDRAIDTYAAAFAEWKKVLERYPDFRQDEFIQEETYEAELRYLDLVREHLGVRVRPALYVQGGITEAVSALQDAAAPAQLAIVLLHGVVDDSKVLPLPVLGPMDGPGPDGQPWISPGTVRTTRQRLGLPVDSVAPPPPSPPTPGEPTPAPLPRPTPGKQ